MHARNKSTTKKAPTTTVDTVYGPWHVGRRPAPGLFLQQCEFYYSYYKTRENVPYGMENWQWIPNNKSQEYGIGQIQKLAEGPSFISPAEC
jgi:hypothetical protein